VFIFKWQPTKLRHGQMAKGRRSSVLDACKKDPGRAALCRDGVTAVSHTAIMSAVEMRH